jgi:hypothetical protein
MCDQVSNMLHPMSTISFAKPFALGLLLIALAFFSGISAANHLGGAAQLSSEGESSLPLESWETRPEREILVLFQSQVENLLKLLLSLKLFHWVLSLTILYVLASHFFANILRRATKISVRLCDQARHECSGVLLA